MKNFFFLSLFQEHYKNQGGQETIQCNDSTVLKKGQLCKLNMSEFFPLNSPCTGANGYGYLSGRPCVLVKLNKVSSEGKTEVQNIFND